MESTSAILYITVAHLLPWKHETGQKSRHVV
jgi:hypothetical protein